MSERLELTAAPIYQDNTTQGPWQCHLFIFKSHPRRLVVNHQNALSVYGNRTCPTITTKLHPIAIYDTFFLIKKGMPCGLVWCERLHLSAKILLYFDSNLYIYLYEYTIYIITYITCCIYWLFNLCRYP